jgi:glycerol-1-phosphatase
MSPPTPSRSARVIGPVTGMTLAQRYDAVFIDLDGVVYRGDHAVPAAPETLSELRRRGVKVLFLTNNSARTPERVAAKLRGLGVPAEAGDVLTSAVATASMLRREGAAGSTAFVIGEGGLREALRQAGIRLVEALSETCDLVVVGWDRSVDYAKLRTASLMVQRGARLIATNDDASYPAPDGLWPGAGALLAAVITTTGARPVVVGKPARPMFEAAAEATGARRPLVVGDRLETDVGGAAGMGWDSVLVLTGAAGPGDLLRTHDLPTYVAPDLSVLLDDPPPARFRPATPGDLPGINELLSSSGLKPDGLEDRLDGTVVCTDDEQTGAFPATARLEALGPGDPSGILRSVAVRQDLRGQGLGLLAAASAIRTADRRGISHVYLFTETAERFFERLGFVAVPRHQLPLTVRKGPHAKGCPGAVAMTIRPGALGG